jgi:hypothetical protein
MRRSPVPRRKYGTLEMVRREIRRLRDMSFKLDPVTLRATHFREGLDAALKAIDSAGRDKLVSERFGR